MIMSRPEFIEAIRDIYTEACNLREGENVLIVADSRMPHEIANDFLVQAHLAGAFPTILTSPTRLLKPGEHHAQSWPAALETAFPSADLVIDLCGVWGDFVTQALRGKTRVLAMSWGWEGAEFVDRTVDLWQRVDREKMKREVRAIAKALDGASEMRVTGRDGTDFVVDIRDSVYSKNDGYLWDADTQEFVSKYEVYPPSHPGLFIPQGRANGTLAIHAYMNTEAESVDLRDQPVLLDIKDSKIVAVHGEGDKVAQFREYIDIYCSDEDIKGPCHAFFGLNPKAKLDTKHIELERYRGALTWGWGDSATVFDLLGHDLEAVEGTIHWDLITVGSTVSIDGQVVLESGRYTDLITQSS
ncbi:hypothetical protein StoSoilB3_43040 (plasmid) [Arthrobacter sp. StoSoilB3]|nr:hypothetical protein StoSoilB3_43040 [Arthrobacter sp. StoSoilB3]